MTMMTKKKAETIRVRCPRCGEKYDHLLSEPLDCGHCGVGTVVPVRQKRAKR